MINTVPQGAAMLLEFIREAEVGSSGRASYDVIYGHNQGGLAKPLTAMTVAQVLAAQKGWSKAHGSSAAGAYQFMRATLAGLLKEVAWLRGDHRFDAALQDRLALHLLNRRGLAAFLAGEIGRAEFARRLAMEWASLPVLTDSKGSRQRVRRGQSYYAGDGQNRALVRPERLEGVLGAALAASKQLGEANREIEAAPVAPVRTRKPVSRSGRFWTWLLTAGGTILTALKELNLVALDWRVQLAILAAIIGFAVYAIWSMPAVRDALGLTR
ncbi:hypothetical protein GHK50_06680 [Sinorhizobium medicae]|uniref:Transmembrane protein n=1 Tax=Sinorhizobium medicae TaxID=110321 RepID=A0A6G1WJ51_9HYPH|nr:hypothetical protein [Sinorhizobium medicae]MQW69734.1 hypothetical protein [Sinorhizobium medicae]MQX82794.1 hypothetical protein [Sinorhizobium medicae]